MQLWAREDVVDPGSFRRKRPVEVAVAGPVHAICKPRRIGNRLHARTRRGEFYDCESPSRRRRSAGKFAVLTFVDGIIERDARFDSRDPLHCIDMI